MFVHTQSEQSLPDLLTGEGGRAMRFMGWGANNPCTRAQSGGGGGGSFSGTELLALGRLWDASFPDLVWALGGIVS